MTVEQPSLHLVFSTSSFNMDFQCYLCEKQFNQIEQILQHLKLQHRIVVRNDSLKCVVKKTNCEKTYYTMKNWRHHIEKCLKEQKRLEQASFVTEFSNINVSEGQTEEFDHKRQSSDYVYDGDSFSENSIRYQTLLFEESVLGTSAVENQTFVFDPIVDESCVERIAESAETIATSFFMGISKLGLNQNTLDSIFRPTIELISRVNELCCKNIAVRPNFPIELLNATTDDVIANLKRFDSTYKRSKYFKSHTDFVGSLEHGIGTHWELKRNKQSKVMLPHHVQSGFTYIPILPKIKSIFNNDGIRQTYFDFNEAMNHICNEGIYKDFCCGEKCKQNMLY